ncbi:transglutaminase-like domain-containing protein [Fundidesulfovibrio terrae]|uniref:transglutaminase-like domain-containing protein n=1 Tax=Fundidesulfovibrio terrae TaxID=2922866 RepID=UPI001FAFB42C|nr:transglutaminase-like domain-containing protein [Fundidesulfovibrio terrae]
MRYKFILPVLLVLAFTAQAAQAASGTITMTVTPSVLPGSRQADVWLPYPFSNDTQDIAGVSFKGNYDSVQVLRDPKSGANYLYAAWSRVDAKDKPALTLSFHVDSHFRKLAPLKDSKEPIPADIKAQYLASDDWTPSEAYADQAAKIVKGKRTVLSKARAVYDWTVDNTFRDPAVQGCGLGIPGRTLCEMKGGGKCADISTVFVTLARAAGVPAREVFGLRMADPKTGDITGDYHCWAEFYLPGTGWVPADPADVRKMMLVKNLEAKSPEAERYREFFWGGDDLTRITLNIGSRGVVFNPAQKGGPVNYFMYPFGQVDGETLNYFDPKAFSFSVGYKAD